MISQFLRRCKFVADSQEMPRRGQEDEKESDFNIFDFNFAVAKGLEISNFTAQFDLIM